MALIYFVIFICAISTVFCDQCVLGDDETSIKIYILYLLAFTMLFMIVVIIYLCFALRKLKNSLIFENKTTMNIEQYRIDGSTQTIYSGITEIKEINESTMAVCIEENKTPVILKKSLVPKMEIIPKQQMDKIITEVLNRKPRSESGTFRDLIALTKRKSSDLGANKIFFNRKFNANTSNTKIDVKAEEELYGNSSVKDETAVNSNNEAVEKALNNSKLFEKKEKRDEPDSTTDKFTKTIDKVDDEVSKSIPIEIHGTSPHPAVKVVEVYNTEPNVKIVDINESAPNLAVKVDGIYDVVPNPVLKVDNIYNTVPNPALMADGVYDTVPNIVVKVDDVYDTLPNSALKVDDLYDTVPNLAAKVDDVNDTVTEQVKRVKNNDNDTHMEIPDLKNVLSGPKERLRAIFDNDTGYALLINEEESKENARYINANDML